MKIKYAFFFGIITLVISCAYGCRPKATATPDVGGVEPGMVVAQPTPSPEPPTAEPVFPGTVDPGTIVPPVTQGPPVHDVEYYIQHMCGTNPLPFLDGELGCFTLYLSDGSPHSLAVLQSVVDSPVYDGNAQLFVLVNNSVGNQGVAPVDISTRGDISPPTATLQVGGQTLVDTLQAMWSADNVCLPAHEGQLLVYPVSDGDGACDSYFVAFPVGDIAMQTVGLSGGNSPAEIASALKTYRGEPARALLLPESLARATLEAILPGLIAAQTPEIVPGPEAPTLEPTLDATTMHLYLVEGSVPMEYNALVQQGLLTGALTPSTNLTDYNGMMNIFAEQVLYMDIGSQSCSVGGPTADSYIQQVFCPDNQPRWLYASNAPIPSIGGQDLGTFTSFLDIARAQEVARTHNINVNLTP